MQACSFGCKPNPLGDSLTSDWHIWKVLDWLTCAWWELCSIPRQHTEEEKNYIYLGCIISQNEPTSANKSCTFIESESHLKVIGMYNSWWNSWWNMWGEAGWTMFSLGICLLIDSISQFSFCSEKRHQFAFWMEDIWSFWSVKMILFVILYLQMAELVLDLDE